MTDSPLHPPSLAELRARRDEIFRVAAAHHAGHVRVFGSVARGQADAASDVDFLVDITEDLGGFGYFGELDRLRQDLEALLGRKVHIMDSEALIRMRDCVLSEAVEL